MTLLLLLLAAAPDALGCPAMRVSPPVTIHSAIDESSCINRIDLRTEVFSVRLREGEILDVDYSSREFEVYLFMSIVGGRSGPDRRASWLSSGTSRVTMRYVAEETRTYEIEAMHLVPLDWGERVTGAYTLKIGIAGASDCTPPTIFGLRTWPRLLGSDPMTVYWLVPVTGDGRWSFRASNACGTIEESHLPPRRRAVAR